MSECMVGWAHVPFGKRDDDVESMIVQVAQAALADAGVEAKDVDAIVVPYGGGGLSCGIACAVQALKPGTPVYGAFTTWQTPFWYVDSYLRPAGTTPDPTTWPTLHNFVDVGVFAGQSEFTVQQAHGEAIWTFGALLGTSDFSS